MRMGFARLVALAALLLSPTATDAAYVSVTSRAALGGNDFVDWASPLGTLPGRPNVRTFTSAAGLGGNVSVLASNGGVPNPGPPVRRTQGPTDFNGNFALGDALLQAGTVTAPTGLNAPVPLFSILFSSPVLTVGAQLGWEGVGTFTARVQVFGSGGSPFVQPTNLVSSSANDNSAPFVGWRATGGDTISRIDYYAWTVPNPATPNVRTPVNVTINRLDIVTQSPLIPVPTPPSAVLALAGIGCYALSWLTRRRPRAG